MFKAGKFLCVLLTFGGAPYYLPVLEKLWPKEAAAQVSTGHPGTPAVIARCGDGDTCTLTSGERVRLLDIDAPELGGARCGRERDMALKARDRLSALTAGKRVELRGPNKRDRYDRRLAYVYADSRDVGGVLMAEGLAVRWRPGLGKERPGPWC